PTCRAAPCSIASCSQRVVQASASAGESPSPSRAASAEDSEQPVPCVLVVSTRVERTPWCVPSASTQVVVSSRPTRWPVFTTTATPVSAAQASACAIASCPVRAGGDPVSTASSSMFGVTTLAARQKRSIACSAAGSRSRSPLVATITGSTTSTRGGCAAIHSATVSMTSTVPSIPVLTASRQTSSETAASWAASTAVGGTWISRTPCVFWATTAVTTAIAYPPAAVIDLRSAAVPAPPEGSVPAIESTRGSAAGEGLGAGGNWVQGSVLMRTSLR